MTSSATRSSSKGTRWGPWRPTSRPSRSAKSWPRPTRKTPRGSAICRFRMNKVGDVKLQQGDTAGALAAYQQGLAISEKLAAADPQNAQGQRDLSISYIKLGDAKLQQKDTAGAWRPLSRAWRSAKSWPQPTCGMPRQRDWMVSHYKLGLVHNAEKKFGIGSDRIRARDQIVEEFHQRLGKEPFAVELADAPQGVWQRPRRRQRSKRRRRSQMRTVNGEWKLRGRRRSGNDGGVRDPSIWGGYVSASAIAGLDAG